MLTFTHHKRTVEIGAELAEIMARLLRSIADEIDRTDDGASHELDTYMIRNCARDLEYAVETGFNGGMTDIPSDFAFQHKPIL